MHRQSPVPPLTYYRPHPCFVTGLLCLAGVSALGADFDPPALRFGLDRLDRQAQRSEEPRGVGFVTGAPGIRGIPVTAEAEFAATQDSNALGVPGGGPDDWHWDWEAKLKAKLWQGESISATLQGVATGSLYDTYSSEDFNALGVGPALRWTVSNTWSVTLSDLVLWAFPGDFAEQTFARNRVSLGVAKEIPILADRLSLTLSPGARRDTYFDKGTDRTRAGITAELGLQVTDRLSFAPGASWNYTWVDGGGHFSEVEVYADLRYEFFKRESGWLRSLAATARVYYLHRDLDHSSESLEQVTVAPVLGLTGTF